MNVWLIQKQREQQADLQLNSEHAILTIGKTWRPILLFDSTVTGGTFREYLTVIRSNTDAALFIDPCCRIFPLPCRSGIGNHYENHNDFEWQFSSELCCEYAYDGKISIILRDTRKTILKKAELAQYARIPFVLLSEAAHQMITASSK